MQNKVRDQYGRKKVDGKREEEDMVKRKNN
jgi:hypothetical protein